MRRNTVVPFNSTVANNGKRNSSNICVTLNSNKSLLIIDGGYRQQRPKTVN